MARLKVKKTTLYGFAVLALLLVGVGGFMAFQAPAKNALYDKVKNNLSITPVNVGDPAPEFEYKDEQGAVQKLLDVEGQELRLKDYDGQPRMIFFFATWCGSCIEKAPGLKAIYDKYQDQGLAFVGVSIDASDPSDKVREFRDQYFGGTGRWAVDSYGTPITFAYNVTNTSEMFLVDRDGRITYAGFDYPEALEARMLSTGFVAPVA